MTEIQSNDPFREMDRRDEEQILAELEGKYLEEFVYQFHQGNRTVTGLSWAGIKEIAYRMGNINVDLERFEENETHFSIFVKATDSERGNTRLGVYSQPKTMKRRDGSEEPDQFALQKALSKAQRNAMRALMPEQMLKVWISTFLGYKTGKPEPPKKVESSQDRSVHMNTTEDVVRESLEAAGLDAGALHIYTYGMRLYVDPAGKLEAWADYNTVLRGLGATWRQLGQFGRWEISPER